MKKYFGVAAAIAMVFVLSGGAWAVGSVAPTVNASLTVANVCSASNDGVIDFGVALDGVANATGVPFVAGLITTQPTINCTAGATYVVTAASVNAPGFRLKNGTANYVTYSLPFTSPITGHGFTTSSGGSGAGNLALTPSISAGALDVAPAGLYSDTVTLTISY